MNFFIEIEYFILLITTIGGIAGWCANITVRNWQKSCDSALSKHRDNLENFYWPLLQRVQFITQRPRLNHTDDYETMVKIIERFYGRSVPRKKLSVALMNMYIAIKTKLCESGTHNHNTSDDMEVVFALEECLPLLEKTAYKLSKRTQILLGVRRRNDIFCARCVISACIQDSLPNWCKGQGHKKSNSDDKASVLGSESLDDEI